jgi:arginyl-tRNA synthetase
VAQAGDLHAPHRIAHYLEELAGAYHKWYNLERVVPMALTGQEEELPEERREALRRAKAPQASRAAARLKLNDAARMTIAAGLDLLGVQAPEHM